MEHERGRGVDALPGLVWTALPNGQIDFLNQRWCEYTGLGVDQSCGLGWQTVVHPEDLPRLLAGWRSVPASSAPLEAEARLRGRTGNIAGTCFSLTHRLTHPARSSNGTDSAPTSMIESEPRKHCGRPQRGSATTPKQLPIGSGKSVRTTNSRC
jgi:PAS domain-containing protein